MMKNGSGKPYRCSSMLSTQHDPDVTQEQIHEDIKKYVFDPIIPDGMVDADTKYFHQSRQVALLSVDHTETAD